MPQQLSRIDSYNGCLGFRETIPIEQRDIGSKEQSNKVK